MRVLSCEEYEAGYRPRLARFDGLWENTRAHRRAAQHGCSRRGGVEILPALLRIAYIMTGETACRLFSRIIARLQEKGLSGTVTCGHAGGGLEAVNVYSALAACREPVEADFIILGPGPGSIGTASSLGFSGMDGRSCQPGQRSGGRLYLSPDLLPNAAGGTLE